MAEFIGAKLTSGFETDRTLQLERVANKGTVSYTEQFSAAIETFLKSINCVSKRKIKQCRYHAKTVTVNVRC